MNVNALVKMCDSTAEKNSAYKEHDKERFERMGRGNPWELLIDADKDTVTSLSSTSNAVSDEKLSSSCQVTHVQTRICC